MVPITFLPNALVTFMKLHTLILSAEARNLMHRYFTISFHRSFILARTVQTSYCTAKAGISLQSPARISLSATAKRISLFPLTYHPHRIYFVSKLNELEVNVSEVSSHEVCVRKVMNGITLSWLLTRQLCGILLLH